MFAAVFARRVYPLVLILFGYGVCRLVGILFFFNATATTEIYTLSLHDALPIFRMFLLLITFLKASHSFRNRLLVICKNAYLFATMIMTSVSSPFSCCSGIVRLNLM